MSKSRNKDRSELEHLRGENRSLLKENRRLKKLLRQQEKEATSRDIDILDELLQDELNHKEERKEKCSQCGIGSISRVDLGIKELIKCSECSYRRTKEK